MTKVAARATGALAVCIYAGADGTSRLAEIRLPFAARQEAADGTVSWLGRGGAQEWVVIGGDGKPGEFGDWHVSAVAGLSIVVDGAWEIEAGDGARRQLGLGSILVMLDTDGQGHRSRAVSGHGSTVLGVSFDALSRSAMEERLAAVIGA